MAKTKAVAAKTVAPKTKAKATPKGKESDKVKESELARKCKEAMIGMLSTIHVVMASFDVRTYVL